MAWDGEDSSQITPRKIAVPFDVGFSEWWAVLNEELTISEDYGDKRVAKLSTLWIY